MLPRTAARKQVAAAPMPESFDIFPLPSSLQSAPSHVEQVRELDSVLFGVQPIVSGPLASLRALASAQLSKFSGLNVGYGWPEWKRVNLAKILREPVGAWLVQPGLLGWEVSTGLALWLAAFAGSDKEKVIEWHAAFARSATPNQQRGDFFKLSNTGRPGSIPSIDSLLYFFRDLLLNRIIELVPALRTRYTNSMDPEILSKIHEWLVPPQSMWQAILDADSQTDRHLYVRLKEITDATKQSLLGGGLIYVEDPKSTHVERFNLIHLPSYYLNRDYAQAIDCGEQAPRKLEWPAQLIGPTNVRTPESFTKFMELHLRHNHVVLIDAHTVGFLQVLIPVFPSSEQHYARIQSAKQEVEEARALALENLRRTI
jgi:hypothetical protein